MKRLEWINGDHLQGWCTDVGVLDHKTGIFYQAHHAEGTGDILVEVADYLGVEWDVEL